MNKYFGKPLWDAPMYNLLEEVRMTEVIGRRCIWCQEKIEDGDHGIAGLGNHNEIDGVQHIECHMRSIFGSIAHIEGRCICKGRGDEDDTDESGRTWREEGRLVLMRIEAGEV